jgi:hypothetical protein
MPRSQIYTEEKALEDFKQIGKRTQQFIEDHKKPFILLIKDIIPELKTKLLHGGKSKKNNKRRKNNTIKGGAIKDYMTMQSLIIIIIAGLCIVSLVHSADSTTEYINVCRSTLMTLGTNSNAFFDGIKPSLYLGGLGVILPKAGKALSKTIIGGIEGQVKKIQTDVFSILSL